MLKSRTVAVSIGRPFEEVFGFLSRPRNFLRWAANFGSDMVPIDRRDWLVEVPHGRRVLRFAEPNDYGIVDYVAFEQGQQPGSAVPARLVRSREGANLAIRMLERAGGTPDQADSDAEWLQSDLHRLQSLLESEGGSILPTWRMQTLIFPVARPCDEVYAFLADPLTFPTWASNLGDDFVQVGETDWRTTTRNGPTILRFSPPNAYGILDHAVFLAGDEPQTTPMRVVPNGEGSDILYTVVQRGGVPVSAIESEIEWLHSDFGALVSMLESAPSDLEVRQRETDETA